MVAMSVFVDDEQVALAGNDLASLLGAAQQHLQPSGRVVVDVMIDGESLSGEQLGQQDQVETAGREVRLYTADPRSLAVDTLQQVRERLGEAKRMQDEAAEQLQQDEASEALQQVASAIEVWLQTQQAVQNSAALLQVDLDAIEVDGEAVSALTDELAQQLQNLKQLINDGDTVGLADALAYEWPGTTEKWDRLVQELVAKIEA